MMMSVSKALHWQVLQGMVKLMSFYTEDAYEEQLHEKCKLTQDEFGKYGVEEFAVYKSEPNHFRMRAEFRVWHDGDELDYVMFNQETKERYSIEQLPIASELINELMPKIIGAVKSNRILRTKLFQVDYLSSLSDEVVVSLLYHKSLCDDWEESVREMKKQFEKQGYRIDFIGRARKQKRVIDREFVVEKLNVLGRELVYKQVENSFTQPNAKVAQGMLAWALDTTRESKGDLLELYCGNGNFSIALAQNFKNVLATELAKPSVAAAQWNITENKVTNLKIARLSAEEFTEAMEGTREFKRLQQQEINLKEYTFSTVLVDPPRAGLDDDTLQMIANYETILYISCNPDSLRDNLEELTKTHELVDMAMFDQFPYTHHRELGVLLKRIKS